MNFDPSVIGILRGIDSIFFGELMQASFNEGLRALEVTINTPGAERIVATHRHLEQAARHLDDAAGHAFYRQHRDSDSAE